MGFRVQGTCARIPRPFNLCSGPSFGPFHVISFKSSLFSLTLCLGRGEGRGGKIWGGRKMEGRGGEVKLIFPPLVWIVKKEGKEKWKSRVLFVCEVERKLPIYPYFVKKWKGEKGILVKFPPLPSFPHTFPPLSPHFWGENFKVGPTSILPPFSFPPLSLPPSQTPSTFTFPPFSPLFFPPPHFPSFPNRGLGPSWFI